MKNTIFDKDDAENGKMIETKNARNGGYLVGRSHKNGGIKGVNVDTGEPIEVEGGEVVITKPAVESNKFYTLNGKKMKPKEILSKLNSDHGGVSFAKGGKVGGDKYLLGGISESDRDMYLNQRMPSTSVVLRTTSDDMHAVIYKVNNVKILANEEIVVNTYDAEDGSEESIELMNCLKIGDIFYIKGMKKGSTMGRELKSANPNFEFDFAEIPFTLQDILSENGTMIKTLVFERSYIDDNGNEKVESFDWVRADYGFANDDIIAVPKIDSELIANLIGDSNYTKYSTNSQDFLNGKFVLLLLKGNQRLAIAGYGKRANRDNEVLLQTKTWDSGFVFTHVRAYTASNVDYPISAEGYDGYAVAVGDVWEMQYTSANSVEGVGFVPENLQKQKLRADGIYVIPYADNLAEARDHQLFYTDSTDPNILSGDIFFRDAEIITGKRKVNIQSITQSLKIIGFIFTKLENGLIKGNCNYFLVENVDTQEKLIVSTPQFLRPIKMVTAEDYGQPMVMLSDDEKEIRKVKKKDERDAQLYQILLEGLSQEEAKLIVMKGLISSSDKRKNLNIDRRLNEIAVLKAQYKLDSQTALNLLDQFETMYYTEKSSRENKSGDVAINGQATELTPTQYERVRSPEFIDWFGDWMTAYELDDYTGVSKVINPRTAEPMVLFHGTDADFTAWKFNQFPAAYFGDNRSYSDWFAKYRNPASTGHVYECFINIKNPIDMRKYGLDNYKMGEILNYLQETYSLKPSDLIPELKDLTEEQYEQIMNVNIKAWQFVRRNISFLNFVKANTFYDGILMFEDNPQDIITTTVDGETVEVPNTTGSFVVFSEGQIKWAGATYFNSIISDNRFAKGGKVKSLAKKYKEMDFVF